jgi:fimbrial isopeptide formation D2 family protein/LPXTG-motif cell wall-anchored protein
MERETIMKSKNYKRLLAIATASVMALASPAGLAMSTAVNVFATTAKDDVIDTNHQCSLTIHKYDLTAAQQAGVDVSKFDSDGEQDTAAESALASYALKGVEFTYLKVGDINTSSVTGSLKLLYDIPTQLETVLGLSDVSHKYTSDQLNSAIATLLTENTTGKNALEDYITKNGGTAMTETSTAGVASASSLAQGLYLVVETKVPEEVHTTTNPFFVSLPMTDVTGDYWNYDVVVYPKNQTNNPTIDKVVSVDNKDFADTATASEGDTLSYRIVTKLPTITSKATYLTKYTFVDTLSKGITYKKDAAITFYTNASDAKNGTGTAADTWSHGSVNFTETYDDTKNTMTIAMTDTGLGKLNPAKTDCYMVVTYTATVKNTADVVLGDNGNPNDVKLTYSRTNTSEENTIEDKANVYSYGINLLKTFADSKGDATAVQFVLYNKTDSYYVTATGTNGTYYVTDATHGAAEANATKLSPNADGKLIINGLEADDYTLREIQTDDGYSLLKEDMAISFTVTKDTIKPSVATVTGIKNENENVIITNGDRATAKVDNQATTMSTDGTSANARVDMSVVNTQTFLLPQTGGLGTIVFTLIGACVVILGIFVITATTKGSKKNSAN